MARWTKGKARPSLSPASEVSEKRVSSSFPSPSALRPVLGGPTCTSLASTGSVGASAAPSRRAAAAPRPRREWPSQARARIVSGMENARSRQVMRQESSAKGRSILRPAPMSEIMITASVNRSVSWRCSWGRGPAPGTSGMENTSAPKATQKIGKESGSSFKAIGSQAVRSTTAPKPASTTT
jgi:hypothetical protein